MRLHSGKHNHIAHDSLHHRQVWQLQHTLQGWPCHATLHLPLHAQNCTCTLSRYLKLLQAYTPHADVGYVTCHGLDATKRLGSCSMRSEAGLVIQHCTIPACCSLHITHGLHMDCTWTTHGKVHAAYPPATACAFQAVFWAAVKTASLPLIQWAVHVQSSSTQVCLGLNQAGTELPGSAKM